MNTLPAATKAAVLNALANGVSVRATCRMTGAAKGTVLRLLVDAARFCETYHHHVVSGLATTRVEADEAWSFCGAKQRNAKHAGQGDLWCFVCLDADSKLVVTWVVGDRTQENAVTLMRDAARRIATDQVMISTDAWGGYLEAVRRSFGWQRANYARIIKVYAAPVEDGRRYSPPVCTSVQKEVVMGEPAMELASTSYVENLNLSTRQHCKRFARLTIAHSRKAENHAAAVSLNFFAHNFIRVHSTLSKRAGRKTTPAMANGLADKPMTFADVVAMMDPRTVTIK